MLRSQRIRETRPDEDVPRRCPAAADLPPASPTAQQREGHRLDKEVVVDMVIDSAGKVWSIKTVGEPDQDLIRAATNWKFVPALI